LAQTLNIVIDTDTTDRHIAYCFRVRCCALLPVEADRNVFVIDSPEAASIEI